MAQLTFNGQRLHFPGSGVLEYFPPFELLTSDFIGTQNGGSFVGETINIGGTNASRTSSSDTAYNDLVSAGNTVTVN